MMITSLTRVCKLHITIWKQSGFEYIMRVPVELKSQFDIEGWLPYCQIIHYGTITNLYFSRRFTREKELYSYCESKDVKIIYLDNDDNIKQSFN